ncbi:MULTISPECIES: aminomethyl-transferring glycine dehydrogenase subunit GcvPA [Tissierellales]|jgi:glycine dehydrogenase subunit 1|uniref:Aminomethyl-transferring glycine dehydrogenase subunit GcvPA n=1 Tax=Acidilutibacter cellobiosedens TaxID=2507161 RepID=A0A410QAM0_9FIRM|nr:MULTISPECIES: aminomethyl-transferring glycine dehydrogenase subunit GcvPA [Tissierellales]QAT61007.1 aminomethyl-transferring glycine dehydrogenase subunit GcvPA [Acidilutibacter cellobiosedens]SCL89336.1 putative glycine dehydrogenase [decarboxylating] subunit 1 [Sporanaerobacter sp. PP17-6a]
MTNHGFRNHPYIPNSDEDVQKKMLREIGLKNLEDLHSEIPEELRFKRKLNLPEPYTSEYELKREVEKLLRKNISSNEYINFLGAGCWQHYVPAICDEIANRAEFLSGYAGEPYNDHGRFQALFEYESLVAELVDMDVVNVPTFDWAQAAATALRMSSRITSREDALVVRTISRDKLDIIKNYCDPGVNIILVDYDTKTGMINMNDLKNKISDETAAVYFENPSYLGFIEEQGNEISKVARDAGALSVVGVDPSSLGVMETPSAYGADIICGDLQPLGMHMNYGGGQSGFIATRDEKKFVLEFPSRLFGIAPTIKEGEYGFGDIAYERTSFGNLREKGKEYVGTQTALYGITAGVYLSLMGPHGMFDLGKNIMQKSQYAIEELTKIEGVKGSKFSNVSFKEFVVDFNDTNKTVKEINEKLLAKGIFGGKDLSEEFPELGQAALYCVTEVHLKEDIDTLVNEIKKIVRG